MTHRDAVRSLEGDEIVGVVKAVLAPVEPQGVVGPSQRGVDKAEQLGDRQGRLLPGGSAGVNFRAVALPAFAQQVDHAPAVAVRDLTAQNFAVLLEDRGDAAEQGGNVAGNGHRPAGRGGEEGLQEGKVAADVG